MYNTISLDLETLDVNSTAVVLSIGAAAFNLDEIDDYPDFTADRLFYETIKLQPQIDLDRTISASTLMWWMNQSKAAQAGISDESQQRGIDYALTAFNDFCQMHKANYIMGNGNMFDNVILRSLYSDFRHRYPVPFWADIDLRTMQIMSGIPKIKFAQGVAHNAQDDAVHQAISAQRYYQACHQKT